MVKRRNNTDMGVLQNLNSLILVPVTASFMTAISCCSILCVNSTYCILHTKSKYM